MKLQSMKKSKRIALCFITLFLCVVLGLLATASSASAVSYDVWDAADGKFMPDFATMEDADAYGRDLAIEIAGEGSVLMKNRETLPFASNVKNISLFGINSSRGGNGYLYGGVGSGVGRGDRVDLTVALKDGGFNLNSALLSAYAGATVSSLNGGNNRAYSEVALSVIEPAQSSYKLFNDAAVIVISRGYAESRDAMMFNLTTHSDKLAHQNTLQDNEKELIEHVTKNFDNVVVLLNTPAPVEIAGLEDNDGIGAILWVGYAGVVGTVAIPKILKGEFNPSGRTVEAWLVNEKLDPTWTNFGNNGQNMITGTGTTDDPYVFPHASAGAALTGLDNATNVKKTDGTAAGTGNNAFVAIEYKEGIYMGYKFYETAAEYTYFDTTGDKPNNDLATYDTDDAYYNRTNGVVYPFGYGLSYTSFTQEVISWSPTLDFVDGDAYDGTAGNFEAKVKVTNTGNVPGKDVVQVYSTPEYKGTVEKAAANLIDFAKTKILQPNESQVLTISFPVQDLASFDEDGKNSDSFRGYIIEAGNMNLSIRSDSHNIIEDKDYTIASNYKYTKDSDTGAEIKPLFSNGDIWDVRRVSSKRTTPVTPAANTSKMLTRSSFMATLPKAPTADELKYSDETIEQLMSFTSFVATDDKPGDPWHVATVPAAADRNDVQPGEWKQASAADVAARVNGRAAIQYYEMNGVSYDDPKWDTFINQLTWAEMVGQINCGLYYNLQLVAIGKDRGFETDGPSMLDGMNQMQSPASIWWPCPVVTASTFNVELAEKMGNNIGNAALFRNINGWYAPAMNAHRNSLGGRNYEYYSSDGLHAGKIGAAVVRGATAKGLHVYIKHMALHEQEAFRTTAGGLITWLTEQTFREIYMKPFEISAKEGNANGTMSAYGRAGLVPSHDNYMMNIALMEKEFGYFGMNASDYFAGATAAHAPLNLLVRSHVYPLANSAVTTATRNLDGVYDETTNMVMSAATGGVAVPSQWANVRETVKRMLYILANGNQAKNGARFDKFVGNTSATSYVAFVGVPFNESIAVETERPSVYTVSAVNQNAQTGDTSGNRTNALPAGLTLAANGTISGTPTVAGAVNTGIVLKTDGWATRMSFVTHTKPNPYSISHWINVVQPLTYSGDATSSLKAGTEFEGTVSAAAELAVGKQFNSKSYSDIKSVTFSIPTTGGNALPAGLSFDPATGVISGTPTATATRSTNIQAAVVYGNSATVPETTATQNITLTLDFAVSASTRTITFNANYTNGQNVTAAIADGGKASPAGAPYRPGFYFTGWYSDTACTTLANFDDAVTADKTLYAGWLELKDGVSPNIGANGNWFIGTTDTGVKAAGSNGTNGNDGVSPHIGANGNWFIGTTDTGIKAAGSNGTNGNDGKDGTNGVDGAPGTPGTNGVDGKDGKDGVDGAGCSSVINPFGFAGLFGTVAIIFTGVMVIMTRRRAKKD